MARHQAQDEAISPKPDSIIHLWILRILMLLGGHREFIHSHGFNDDTLAETLGLKSWIDSSECGLAIPSFLQPQGSAKSDSDFNGKRVLSDLRRIHQQVERKKAQVTIPACLQSNIDQLTGLVGLSQTDCRLLEFAVLINSERLLDESGDRLGHLSTVKLFHVLSVILELPESEVRKSLSAQGVLERSGLLSVDRHGFDSLRGKLKLLSSAFADLMLTSEAGPISLLRGTVSAVGPGRLLLTDYGHVQPSLEILLPYLRQSISDGRRGVNIFVHGAPGTGKSQLARAVAKELGCELFEVACEDVDGDPVDGEHRLRAFSAAQSFFAQRQALVVFDEVEDVFNDGNGFFGRKSTAQLRKAWINRTLEENPVPTLWLSNSISGLDPAFVRRFDMVFELPVPPKKQREEILQGSCGDLLDASSISRIAEAESLAPAVVAKASSVVRSIRNELAPHKVAFALERLISNTLEAQGHAPLVRYDPNRLPDIYDPAFIQANVNLTAVAAGLVSARAGRLCLYGPPGTGKTAYGRWLAQQIGVPLHIKRASDLMSKWVGDNEKNVAQAFRTAEAEGAMLLIDEVDSFLQDRRGAKQSWEVSLVNEMLTQMESFSGVFIASTNLMEGLDQAALRRFDLKVKFDFLRTEQAWELLCRHCTELELAAPQADVRARMACLDRLTPGDFAAVVRQHRFHPITSAALLVSALEAECAVKEGVTRAMGFL